MKNQTESQERIIITTTMSKAYQVTLPAVFRKKLQLEAGDEIVFEEVRDGILLKKAQTKKERIEAMMARLDEWRDNLSQETKERIKQHAGWTINQYHEYYDNLPETKAYIKEKYGI